MLIGENLDFHIDHSAGSDKHACRGKSCNSIFTFEKAVTRTGFMLADNVKILSNTLAYYAYLYTNMSRSANAACINIYRFLRLDFQLPEASCGLDFQLLAFRKFLRTNRKTRHFYFNGLQRLACPYGARTSCHTSCACIIFGLYCALPQSHIFNYYFIHSCSVSTF